MRYALPLITFMLSIFPSLAWAADANSHNQMKGEALREVFQDTMALSEYRNHKGFHKKGYDFTEFHHANGTTDYTEVGAKTDKGLWKIIGNDKVCYRYPSSPNPNSTHCFFVYKQGKCYYNFGIGSMTLNGPRSWDLWISRFVRKGSGGSCGDAVG